MGAPFAGDRSFRNNIATDRDILDHLEHAYQDQDPDPSLVFITIYEFVSCELILMTEFYKYFNGLD